MKIFLDSANLQEIKEAMSWGAIDGVTTNPTLIAQNPYAKTRFEKGERFTQQEIMDFYRSIVTDISTFLPSGSISIEVYADKNTTADEMLAQGRGMFAWIPNAHIKYPTTAAGLEAAARSVKEGMRVNMTLVFSQEQAAAVHTATRGAKKGDVFVSPFIGRLDDIGENGMDLIKNIRRMYDEAGSHVEILAASIRSTEHFLTSLAYGADIITAPAKVIVAWVDAGKSDGTEYVYNSKGLRPIAYKQFDLSKGWRDFDIVHPLTEKGVDRFASDWNGLIR